MADPTDRPRIPQPAQTGGTRSTPDNTPDTASARTADNTPDNTSANTPDTASANTPDTAGANTAPVRVVLAKLGLDGHDRGLKVVARMLRDAGMEVIYLGLRQTTDTVVAAAEQEDADVIGLSMHNAGHLALAPRMVQAVTDAGLDVPVVIGGIVPEADVVTLKETGVSAVLHPGASARDVVNAVQAALRNREAAQRPSG